MGELTDACRPGMTSAEADEAECAALAEVTRLPTLTPELIDDLVERATLCLSLIRIMGAPDPNACVVIGVPCIPSGGYATEWQISKYSEPRWAGKVSVYGKDAAGRARHELERRARVQADANGLQAKESAP